MSIAAQRCFAHNERGASGRCPACIRFYCRECLTEHEGRVLCTRCLQALTKPGDVKSFSILRGITRGVAGLLGVAFAGAFFYLVGLLMARLPASFHDGSALSGLFK